LTGDDPTQATAARIVFATGPVWLAKTVLLETAWVLRKLYGYDEGAICGAFQKLLGLANVYAEDGPGVMAALKLAAAGLEFADAIHIESRPHGAAFRTFDSKLIRRAKRAGASAVLPPV
jgi:predicted nucleic-acid-binding protein